MNNDLMFSSRSQAWATRFETFNSIQEQLGRDYLLDPCCHKETAKCSEYYTEEDDMFKHNWTQELIQKGYDQDEAQFFCNPEYGTQQSKFVKKFIQECEKGGRGDVLIPSRTDTKLFHEIILPKAKAIYFVKGRITFGSDEYWEWIWSQPTMEHINGKMTKNSLYEKFGRATAAPFPSMVVSFDTESVFDTGKDPLMSNIVLPKFKYEGKMGKVVGVGDKKIEVLSEEQLDLDLSDLVEMRK